MSERFRRKAVEVEAVQWTGENIEEVEALCADRRVVMTPDGLHLPAAGVWAHRGEWIVRDGDLLRVFKTIDLKPTYEPADQPTQPVLDLEGLRQKVRAELHSEGDEDGSRRAGADECDGSGVLVNRHGGPGAQWVNAECPGCPRCQPVEGGRPELGLVKAIELVLPDLGPAPNSSEVGHFAEDCALVHVDHFEGLAMARSVLTDAISKVTGEPAPDIHARLVSTRPCDCPSCIGAEAAEKARAAYLASTQPQSNQGPEGDWPLGVQREVAGERLRRIADVLENGGRDDSSGTPLFLRRLADELISPTDVGEGGRRPEPLQRIAAIVAAARRLEAEVAPRCEEGLPNDIARAQGESQAASYLRELLEEELPPKFQQSSEPDHHTVDRVTGDEPGVDEWCCDTCGKIAPVAAVSWEQTPQDDAGVSVERCPDCRLHPPTADCGCPLPALEREEIEALLRPGSNDAALYAARAKLRAALDAPSVEGRVEYFLSPPDHSLPACYRGVLDLQKAQTGLRLSRQRGLGHRIQTRTIFTTQWVDIEGDE